MRRTLPLLLVPALFACGTPQPDSAADASPAGAFDAPPLPTTETANETDPIESDADAARDDDDAREVDAANDATEACSVAVRPVARTSDFHQRPLLALADDGAGALVYAANGASTGRRVTGTFFVPLSAGGVPSADPTALDGSLLHDLTGGPIVATAGDRADFTLRWLSASGAATRTIEIPDARRDLPSLARAGGTVWVGWAREGVASIAAYDDTTATVPARAHAMPEGRDPRLLLVADDDVDLLWSAGDGSSPTLSFARIAGGGALGSLRTSAEPLRATTAAVRGSTLAYATTAVVRATAPIQVKVEARSVDRATGAARGRLSTSLGAYAPALRPLPDGFALAWASDTGVWYAELGEDLAIRHMVRVAPKVQALGTGLDRPVDVAVTTGASYVAFGDEGRQVQVAQIRCR
jgi:hypothetical protein